MKNWFCFYTGLLLTSILSYSCNGKAANTDTSVANQTEECLLVGNFNADSAYRYIERQVAFGPRVPGTEAHEACAEYLVSELKRHGVDTMSVQRGTVTAFNGDVLPITNIIAGFNAPARNRVLLVAHYDTRPWADNESSEQLRNQPILGANDGASGVGVILEIARNLGMKRPNIGVDILFVDAEDYGDNSSFGNNSESWCLGSQYWTQNKIPYSNPDVPMPSYGILLDMVGGKNARFHYEAFSKEFAPQPTFKIWSEAQRLKHGNVFITAPGGNITDDHVFITNAGIPTTDIIETNNEETSSFPPTWHTHNDNMSNISKSTLKAVGETVLNVLYKEKAY